MKVLIADLFEQSGIDALERGGCQIDYRPELRDAALVGAVRDTGAEVLVVRSTPVTSAVLEAGVLSLVVRAGAGYNTIDVAAASSRGIYVSNCPGRNAVAVAELTFALMLALDRRIPDMVADLRAGIWNKHEYAKARGLFGRTLGLLGFGHVGQEVATRAHAFGMPVVVWSRRFGSTEGRQQAAGLPIRIVDTPQEAAEQSDVLSVHLALTPETRGLVGAAVLEKLRPGALFLNTARSEIVDYDALASVVRERQVRAGLDVFPGEPSSGSGAFTPPLASLPTVYGTHHVGASTEQAQDAIAEEAARIVLAYQGSGRAPNTVNLARTTPATHTLVVRHRDRPGVLAHVFDGLRASGINVQETENVVFEGATAAVARINVDAAPPPPLVTSIKNGNSDIIELHVIAIAPQGPQG